MITLHKKLTRQFLRGLVCIGLLYVMSFLAFHFYFQTMERDGYLINVSGRLRMLSQQIAYFLVDLRNQPSPARVERIRQGLDEVQSLLNNLDQMVLVFENENNRHGEVLFYIEATILLLGLLVLLFARNQIFKPMLSQIAEKANKLVDESRLTNLLLDVTVIANESWHLDEAMEKTLIRVCRHTNWPLGHAYVVDPRNRAQLISTKIWYSEHENRFEQFKRITEATDLTLGSGLPGRVLQDRVPAWIRDVNEDKNFPRNRVTKDIGVRSAFAFPIVVGNDVVAVLEFFSDKIIERNESLLNIISHIGRQLGQMCERSDHLTGSQAVLVTINKMSALGEMAAGVAHEINNPLAVIRTVSEQVAELVDDTAPDVNEIKRMTSTIVETANRIAKIIQGFRSFSRDGTHDPMVRCEARQIVTDTIVLCSSRFKQQAIDLIIDEISPTLMVDCRPSEISQILLNLLNNAYDAIEKLDSRWVKVNVVEHEKTVEFRVTDSGAGIARDVVTKLFQPFFTTKEPGKGTGLGLGISRRIAEGHFGELFVDEASAHTCFVLRLPNSSDAASSTKEAA